MTNNGGRIGKRKRKYLKIKIFLAITCVSLGLLVFLASPFFYITTIKVTGAFKYTDAQLTKEMGLGSGDSIFYRSRSSMLRGLEALPYVRRADVKKVYPNTLIVQISERTTRACVRDDKVGVYLYIDEDGYVLDIRASAESGLPVVMGLKLSGYSIGEKLPTENTNAFACVTRLASIFTKYGITDVTGVDVSDTSDIRLYINNVEVVVGSIEDADVKVNWALSCLAYVDKSVRGTLYASDTDNTYFAFPSSK